MSEKEEQKIELKPKVVMVVDDSPTMIKTAKLFLKDNEKFVVHSANNGYEALAMIMEVKPDIIFLDIMMDSLNGYDACHAIKSNPLFSSIPIIMLSSKDSPFDKAKGKMIGCDDYLTKPFDKASITGMLEKYFPELF